MRGTPSMVLIDNNGTLRAQHFGDISELQLGAEIATLLGEAAGDLDCEIQDASAAGACKSIGCSV